MSIKLLNEETIQLINNSQIISSIYSAVKELVENSLDAQAQNIELNLVNNGLSVIEVKDNGSGISRVDAQYMALPSHTSKISNFHDLVSLSTYGFRGESLTSICQVSDVTICTKTVNDETMTCYTLDNKGFIVNSTLCHGTNGTSVKLTNLFKNMPVRRNIFNNKKKANQEIKAIEILLKSFAICKYSIRFMFRVENNVIFTKSSCKNICEALKCVLGIEIVSKLMCIEKNFSQTEMQLFVPKKCIKDYTEISQVDLQFICINDRPIKSKKIEKLVNKRISEYFNLCTSNYHKFIFCLIIKVDSSMLDVNLEPNKDKVFLQNEAIILSEIDKSLFTFYELTDFRISKQNNVKNINFNENLNVINKEKMTEKTWSVCKKRKSNNSSFVEKNISNVKVNKDNKLSKSKNKVFENISKPILSDLVLKNMDELNKNKEYNKYLLLDVQEEYSKNESELFDFAENILEKKQIIEESLSQLPQVDLGEDFDENDIINKSNTSRNTEELNIQQITGVPWSKGNISGLQSNVAVISEKNISNILNCKEKYCKSQETQLKDSGLFYFNKHKEQINDDKKVVSDNNVSTIKIDEFDGKLIMKNLSKKIPTKNSKFQKYSLNTCLDDTQTKISFAGNNADLINQPSAFAMYCTTIRPKFVKQHPELTPTEVATYMNKQWKQISLKEREYYRNLANQQIQNVPNSHFAQTFPKKKFESDQFEKNKNKKHFLSMLGNMKMNKAEVKTGSKIMRTFITWKINTSSVTEKFKKPVEEIGTRIVGSLNTLFWILNLTSKLFIFDVTELEVQLNMKSDVTQINAKYVENLIDQWFTNKNDMSVFHPFHSFET